MSSLVNCASELCGILSPESLAQLETLLDSNAENLTAELLSLLSVAKQASAYRSAPIVTPGHKRGRSSTGSSSAVASSASALSSVPKRPRMVVEVAIPSEAGSRMLTLPQEEEEDEQAGDELCQNDSPSHALAQEEEEEESDVDNATVRTDDGESEKPDDEDPSAYVECDVEEETFLEGDGEYTPIHMIESDPVLDSLAPVHGEWDHGKAKGGPPNRSATVPRNDIYISDIPYLRFGATSNYFIVQLCSVISSTPLDTFMEYIQNVRLPIRNAAEFPLVSSDASLKTTLKFCKDTTVASEQVEMLLILSRIVLAIVVDKSYEDRQNKNITRFYRDNRQTFIDLRITFDQFKKWRLEGERFAILANAGSIYLVLIILFSNLRKTLNDMHMVFVHEVARGLCAPLEETTKTPAEKHAAYLLRSFVVPYVQSLGFHCALKASDLFSPAQLDALGCRDDTLLSNLKENDFVFGQIAMNAVPLPKRIESIWINSNRPILNIFPHPELGHTIYIDYDPDHPDNVTLPFPRGKTEEIKQFLFNFTERERVIVLPKGMPVNDLDTAAAQINTLYKDGVRVRTDEVYAILSVELAKKEPLIVRGRLQKLILLMNCCLPPALCSLSTSKYFTAVSEYLEIDKEFDSARLGFKFDFFAFHFSIYNRRHVKGTGAPHDVSVYHLRKTKGCFNYSQTTPTLSTEYKKHEKLYHALVDAFRDLFAWIQKMVQVNLPDEVENIECFISSIPGRHSDVAPWTNLVVNLNVATTAHRDYGDKGLCGVFVLGDFQGGELCLYEPGFCLPLQSGHMAIFDSKKVTHFNLHCKGWRTSFVFQTDLHMKAWYEDRNDWPNMR